MTTPTCPNCGDKFPFNNQRAMCKKCGLPAEIAHEGSKAVARWRKHPTVTSVDAVTGLVVVQEDRRLSKRQRKAARKTVHSLGRKRNKHGRQHA